jgi:hypothetical protein
MNIGLVNRVLLLANENTRYSTSSILGLNILEDAILVKKLIHWKGLIGQRLNKIKIIERWISNLA